MSTAKKRPNQPLLSGPSAICHPLVLLFFLVSSTLSVYFLFTSSLRSSSNLNKNTAPLFIIPQPQVIPNHGNGNGSSRTESRLLRLPGNPAKSPAMAEEEP
ncbi:hypothetical protein CRG98_008070, partial [Punica granatum]